MEWFTQYLTGRRQSVMVNNTCSAPKTLKFGVPQGSVLGPILFTIYTMPLGQLLSSFGVSYHFYADDSQVYLSFAHNDEAGRNAIFSMTDITTAVRSWMLKYKLKLNDDKTEFLVVSKRTSIPLSLPQLVIGDCVVNPVKTARNIGAVFDDVMSMSSHVTSICQSAYFYLRNIKAIRHMLTFDTACTVIHAFVTSRLDNCNALLIGLPAYQIMRLQKVQNCAARVITGANKYESITQTLKMLHWLPICQRIKFKVLLLVFKGIHGCAPRYISDLIEVYTPKRTLRSSNDIKLVVPYSKLVTYGDRSFSVAGARWWNKLPSNIRTIDNLDVFKKALKTHLFNEYFN